MILDINITELIGYIILWVAVDLFRKDDSKIKTFSIDWFIILIIVIAAVSLIKN